MTLFSIPPLLGVIAIAFRTHNSGVPVLGSLLSVIVVDAPSDPARIVLENLALWLVLYGGATLLLYFTPKWRSPWLLSFKFNPADPSGALMCREFARSVRGVLIGSAWEVLVNRLVLGGQLPLRSPLCLAASGGCVTLGQFAKGGLAVFLFGDAHFYFSHRLLHTSFLFRRVHKVHHQSFNPDPFSGLSMHPVESVIYFSMAPMISLFAPLWLTRVVFKGLIVFPLESHSGFGSWDIEPSHAHYIHHAKVVYNYGASPMWDWLLGTDYREVQHAQKRAAKAAASS